MHRAFRRSLSMLKRMTARSPAAFRELWPLAPGAGKRLERGIADGVFTADDARHLDDLGRNGYTVFPGAIEHGTVDALVHDVRSMGEHPGCFVTTDHKHGRAKRLSGP